MIHKKDICCPNCNCNNIVKNGHRSNGDQRWRCNECKKSFQLDYRYNANQPGMSQNIDNQILNSSGVRDTARILQINPNTVVNHLKKRAKNRKSVSDR